MSGKGRSNPARRGKGVTAAQRVTRLPCPRHEFQALFAAVDEADCGYLTMQQLLRGLELLGIEVNEEALAMLPAKPPAKGFSIEDFEKYTLDISARQDPSILTIQAFGAGVSRSVTLDQLLQFGPQGLSSEEAAEVIDRLTKEGLRPEVMPALSRMFQLNRRLSMFS